MTKVKLCLGSSCFARGNGEMLSFLQEWSAAQKSENSIEISGCRCTNCCGDGPHLFIDDTKYSRLSKDEVVALLKARSGQVGTGNGCAGEQITGVQTSGAGAGNDDPSTDVSVTSSANASH